MSKRDIGVAALTLIFGAGAAYESAKLPFGTVHSPGQGFFPWWISAVIFLLALLLLFQALTSRSSVAREGSGRVAEGGCALGHPGRLHLPARTARLSALYFSPRPVHVALDRYTTVESRPRRGGSYISRFVRYLRYVAEHSLTTGSALAGCEKDSYASLRSIASLQRTA